MCLRRGDRLLQLHGRRRQWQWRRRRRPPPQIRPWPGMDSERVASCAAEGPSCVERQRFMVLEFQLLLRSRKGQSSLLFIAATDLSPSLVPGFLQRLTPDLHGRRRPLPPPPPASSAAGLWFAPPPRAEENFYLASSPCFIFAEKEWGVRRRRSPWTKFLRVLGKVSLSFHFFSKFTLPCSTSSYPPPPSLPRGALSLPSKLRDLSLSLARPPSSANMGAAAAAGVILHCCYFLATHHGGRGDPRKGRLPITFPQNLSPF